MKLPSWCINVFMPGYHANHRFRTPCLFHLSSSYRLCRRFHGHPSLSRPARHRVNAETCRCAVCCVLCFLCHHSLQKQEVHHECKCSKIQSLQELLNTHSMPDCVCGGCDISFAVERYGEVHKNAQCVFSYSARLKPIRRAYRSASYHRFRSPATLGFDRPYAPAWAIQDLDYRSYPDLGSLAGRSQHVVYGWSELLVRYGSWRKLSDISTVPSSWVENRVTGCRVAQGCYTR